MIPLNILMLSPVNFDQLKQRHQSFAIELAKQGHSVTYVEPLQGSGLTVFSRQYMTNLKIVSVRLPFRCSTRPWLHGLLVRSALRMVMRNHRHKPGQTVLWISEPSMAEFCKSDWQSIIYDRCDLHGSFPGQKREIWKYYEELIFANADLVSVSHSHLLADLPEPLKNCSILAGNACSETFIDSMTTEKPATRPLKLISSGAHFDWIDCDWLQKFAQQPGIELHIAGSGRGSSFKKLIRSNGVVFHGQLTHENLAQLMRTCHIGLLPFKDIELVYGVDPIKAYEYAASGLKIWAPDIAPLRWNTLIDCFIGETADIGNLMSSFKPPLPRCQTRQIAVWGDRLKTILDRSALLQSD